MQDILTAASLVIELSIAALPFIHIASKLMPRKSQPVPGQLEIDFAAPVAVEPEQQEIEVEPVPDPWELPIETAPVTNTIAPLHPPTAYLLLLPAARDQASAKPDYSAMTRDQLRRACQLAGIRWRDAKGKNRHLTVEEMRSALAAAA